ncbi:hypothetical protein [Mycobacterium marinum]|uniref:hypothetical protein n=1 Tax=Mycobacterium marinum TaxID=1781 RepID=UPI003079CA5D
MNLRSQMLLDMGSVAKCQSLQLRSLNLASFVAKVHYESRLEAFGGFPGLGGVGFVGDDRKVLALEAGLTLDQVERKGEGLDGDDDDLGPAEC